MVRARRLGRGVASHLRPAATVTRAFFLRDEPGICDAPNWPMVRKLTQSGAATRFGRFDATRRVARESGDIEVWPPHVLLVDDDFAARNSFAELYPAMTIGGFAPLSNA